MLIMDIPNSPPFQDPVILQTQTIQKNTENLYGAVGVCYLSPTLENIDPIREDEGGYDIGAAARAYADNLFSLKPLANPVFGYEAAQVTLLQLPAHGTLNKGLNQKGTAIYHPDAGYRGLDKVVFLVNIQGYKIKVAYDIKVLHVNDKIIRKRYVKSCPYPNNWWKISYRKEVRLN